MIQRYILYSWEIQVQARQRSLCIVGEYSLPKGVISQNKFIEVSRSDLVGGYIGHTAIKTKEVLESALGGVLFY